MKKLLHFLLFIVGLTLCACTSESNNDDGFDPLSGYNKKFDFSYDQAPRYAVEYLEQEADSHLLKVTRTEYNGTRESKKVHIYIYDNEYNIKIE